MGEWVWVNDKRVMEGGCYIASEWKLQCSWMDGYQDSSGIFALSVTAVDEVLARESRG